MDQDGSLDQLSKWAWVSVAGIDAGDAGRRGRLGNAAERKPLGRFRLTREANLIRRTDFDRHDELSISINLLYSGMRVAGLGVAGRKRLLNGRLIWYVNTFWTLFTV